MTRLAGRGTEGCVQGPYLHIYAPTQAREDRHGGTSPHTGFGEEGQAQKGGGPSACGV
jgi:hypothetical protein